jgi:putative addiction module component (TIGR02574 family)
MSKAEILQELPKLNPEERQEIRAKLNALDGLANDGWIGDELTDEEKAILDRELAEYERDPNAGSSWQEVEARVRAKPAD